LVGKILETGQAVGRKAVVLDKVCAPLSQHLLPALVIFVPRRVGDDYGSSGTQATNRLSESSSVILGIMKGSAKYRAIELRIGEGQPVELRLKPRKKCRQTLQVMSGGSESIAAID